MNKELWHLVMANMAEVEDRLRAQGYEVQREVDGFDMIATKPDHRVVYDFKAPGELGDKKDLVLERRARARSAGFDDFRLVVAGRPHPVEIDVEDFNSALLDYLVRNPPPEIEQMSGPVDVESVEDVEYDSVRVGRDGSRLRGTAVVEMVLGNGEGKRKDLQERPVACPLRFDVRLGKELSLVEASIQVDTDDCF